MRRTLDTVAVYLDANHPAEPRLMGFLHRQAGRGTDVLSFEYDQDWLGSTTAIRLDPDLALVPDPQYPAANRANFGIFLDSSPDRWGRVLMQRRENIRARHEGRRAARSLTDWDFLLGVHDETRLGGLRFKDTEADQWVDSDDALAAPPIASLRDLQAASLRFERSSDEGEVRDQEQWLTQLFAPARRSAAPVRRHRFEMRRERCASRSSPAGKTGAILAPGSWWHTALRRKQE